MSGKQSFLSSTKNFPPKRPGQTLSIALRRIIKRVDTSSLLVSLLALSMAVATATESQSVQWLERQAQSLFQRFKPAIAPPKEIVIVAIDDYSLSQGERSLSSSPSLPHAGLLQRWPWRREAYAIVAQRLMEAGAKAVALDLMFDGPSLYGAEDDAKLRAVLQKYPGRIVLGAVYEEDQLRPGDLMQLTQPHERLRVPGLAVGSINYPLEADGRIHRFASQFPWLWAKQNPDLAQTFLDFVATVPSFARATLQAADVNYVSPKGDRIFFYGQSNTFEQISFVDLLDSENWNSYLEGGKYFRDKIVLIGPTSPSLKDFHPTPLSNAMSGVEVQANEIATFWQHRAIAEFLPTPTSKSIAVFGLVFGVGLFISRRKFWPMRLAWTAGSAIAWSAIAYSVYIGSYQILPLTVPLIGIVLGGAGSTTLGALEELLHKRRLRETMKSYASSPIVREIIAQQDDFRDLLEEREQEMLTTTLGGRYQVLQNLSSGGFGQTYIALDIQRPGTPKCVIKQLRLARDGLNHWKIAHRLLCKEAEILEKLGHHDQIPQLLAYFQEGNEFYLVEEFVDGYLLSRELSIEVALSEAQVVSILQDLLAILEFVHANDVIHRDLKPDNIIRRHSDRKLVLIDFGAVKEVSARVGETDEERHKTIAIGSRGYAPPEQTFGQPRFNSDIYALGMLAIRALTLLHPAKLNDNPETGEIAWEDKASVSPALKGILSKMIRSDFRDRYQSAAEVLNDLQPLIEALAMGSETTVCDAEKTSAIAPQNATWDPEAETIAFTEDTSA
ncbi:serine/threonine-protein kinase [Oscillatoria sp. FACHB-1406]|uniref:serine/threonine-protein kinase n=1 Tax=Oscillatoria sp. FACHB-1406 TaxID=2692846 RepID=UPI001683F862|nr:serine/threonine-protein kinase [Oscillatoria sp. FACHB-1406]MBD2576879.1 CHASE2 domain-containing protein [Oscillatoria sp. FACHB-1406]